MTCEIHDLDGIIYQGCPICKIIKDYKKPLSKEEIFEIVNNHRAELITKNIDLAEKVNRLKKRAKLLNKEISDLKFRLTL